MLIQKYDYKKLKRKNVNKKRHYILEGEVNSTPVPSVTSILSATKPKEDAEALKRWRKNVGYQKAQQITTESANRGTRVHKYLEDYIKTGVFPTPGTNPYAKHANEMAACIVENGMVLLDEIWGTEVALLFPDIYGGSTDLVGVHNGVEAIIDFKQSNKLKKKEWINDYFLQTVAYGQAHNELYGTNINKSVIMMVTPSLEYQEFIIEGDEFDKYRKEWWKRVEQYYLMT